MIFYNYYLSDEEDDAVPEKVSQKPVTEKTTTTEKTALPEKPATPQKSILLLSPVKTPVKSAVPVLPPTPTKSVSDMEDSNDYNEEMLDTIFNIIKTEPDNHGDITMTPVREFRPVKNGSLENGTVLSFEVEVKKPEIDEKPTEEPAEEPAGPPEPVSAPPVDDDNDDDVFAEPANTR